MNDRDVRVKRAYEQADDTDGTRVLVDRIWPRGVKKERAALDEWLKTVAPSTALRKWFGHDPAKWPEFRQRYMDELARGEPAEGLAHLRELSAGGRLTLVFSARDEAHNNAIVLQELLSK